MPLLPTAPYLQVPIVLVHGCTQQVQLWEVILEVNRLGHFRQRAFVIAHFEVRARCKQSGPRGMRPAMQCRQHQCSYLVLASAMARGLQPSTCAAHAQRCRASPAFIAIRVFSLLLCAPVRLCGHSRLALTRGPHGDGKCVLQRCYMRSNLCLTAIACATGLHYFGGRGRAECIRWMLAATHTPFDNVLLTEPEQMDALRAEGKLLFGQLPLLEIDGRCLIQSGAIVRYLADKHDMQGGNADQRVLCDMIHEAVRDFVAAAISFPFQSREEAVPRCTAAVEKWCPHFERIALGNEHPAWIVGSSMAYADVLLAEALQSYVDVLQSAEWLAAYPRLAQLHDAMLRHEGVRAYLISPLRFGVAGPPYVTSVARVLRRA